MAAAEQGSWGSISSALLAECEQRIGYVFKDKALLQAALTHASGAEHRLASNERLEFLGDAILGAVVCELLFQQYPEYLEGDLTRIKSIVVSRQTCAKISEALGMQEFLILGKGNDDPPERAAVAVGRRVRVAGGGDLSRRRRRGGTASSSNGTSGRRSNWPPDGEMGSNYKSLLQQLAQREHGTTPTYQLLDEKGPGPQQVLQDRRPGRRQPLSSRPGAATRRKPSSGPPAMR